ncbi:MAG: flagellar hook protein FlgE [Deltaproteobacteria bacterium]|nr:flagellar hook protein FlgE [Deltaproteobacteria bacterium]
MLGALYSGITGLTANSYTMSILGNNIANTNTVGFKRSNGTFFDILSASLQGGASNIQIGRGVFMGSVKTDFIQGSLNRTENVTDVAIEGDGFFVIRDPNSETLYYTRNGEFIIDREGFLISSDGLRVEGYGLDANGQIDYTKEVDLRVSNVLGQAQATEDAQLGLNLDAEAPVYVATDEATYSGRYSTTVIVYDSQGRDIPLSFTFTKTGINQWSAVPSIPPEFGIATGTSAAASASGIEVLGSGTGPYTLANPHVDLNSMVFSDGSGVVPLTRIYEGNPTPGQVLVAVDGDGDMTLTFGALPSSGAWQVEYNHYTDTGWPVGLTFGPTGLIVTPDPHGLAVELHLSTGAIANQVIDVNFDNVTQYSAPSVTSEILQDGYGAGELKTLEISQEGFITGTFTNGQTREVGQFVLGFFRNLNGMVKVGDTRYQPSRESGQAIHNRPGTGLATVTSFSLELSNVDMASEFVRLITAQRAYTANTKVVSTADAMLADLMNIKR